jgi:2-methylcitrate dehydratase PrpD
MTVAQSLAGVAIALRAMTPSAPSIAATDDAIVDWFGVTLGGSSTVAARAIAAGLSPLTGSSRVVGTHQSAPPATAALINGTAAHALELDDIYAPGLFHPGAPIIAAALAIADQRSCSVRDFKTAVLIGYEVGCRVARDLGPAHYAHWHTTGTAGSVGAAAAASTLLELPGELLKHALSLAATMSAGLQQTFRSDAMGKPLHSGNAAHAGVVAAVAAAGGVTGAADVFEGDTGLAAATGAATSWSHSTAPVEAPLAIEQVTVKPFPCCGHTFAPIDAALSLHAEGVDARHVCEVEVHTYSTAIAVAGIRSPSTPLERRFSIPFVVARALADGRIAETSFTVSTDAVDRLIPRIAMCRDDVFDSQFPERRGARLVITAATGQRREITVPDRPGSPQNPLGPEAIDAKFLDGVTPILNGRAGDALLRLRGGASFTRGLPVI